MPTGESAAPELATSDSWPNVIQPAHSPDDHGPKDREVGVGDDEIVEMRQLLQPHQCLCGPLEAPNEIIDCPQEQKLGCIAIGIQAAQDRPPAP